MNFKPKTLRLTYFAVFTALVIFLQFFGSGIKIGMVSLNFVLIPIILCSMLLGAGYGALIGLIAGFVILICGITGLDGFTQILFADNPVIIILTCLSKTTLAGFISGVLFKAIKKKNGTVATFIASGIAPIINTGVFVLFMWVISGALIKSGFISGTTNAFYAIITGLIGINFIFELILNLVLAPFIYQVFRVIEKAVGRKK